jgi:23S rRNA (cytidine1920-2'-O)/16S rRNA (cytidine1409-2'-O)-methyltransferase
MRLDLLLVRRGLCSGRERAKEAVRAGQVLVDGIVERKPGRELPEDIPLRLEGETLRYVSRGGLKLEKALEDFGIRPEGKICVDCGASTGGFTDCLLQNGAARVYALDVGSGQLAEKLRSDPRVVSREKCNVRELQPGDLPETPELAVIDVSFISLRLVLPAVSGILAPEGEIVCLIKPQFEAGRTRVGKKGVVRDASIHIEILEELFLFFPTLGLYPVKLSWSPIRGPEGNLEYLCHLRRQPAEIPPLPRAVVEEAHKALK